MTVTAVDFGAGIGLLRQQHWTAAIDTEGNPRPL